MQVFHMLFYLCRMLICPNIILNQPLYLVLHAFFGILIEMHSHNIHCATYLLSDFFLKLRILYKFTNYLLYCRIYPVFIPLSFICTAVSINKLPMFACILLISVSPTA